MKTIPEKNRSKTGWWVTIVIERFEPVNETGSKARRLYEVWENEIIFKAPNREAAYKKIMKYLEPRKRPSPVKIGGKDGYWISEGIASLLPVYEPFKDFAEIRWTRSKYRLSTVKTFVRQKHELEAFQD